MAAAGLFGKLGAEPSESAPTLLGNRCAQNALLYKREERIGIRVEYKIMQ